MPSRPAPTCPAPSIYPVPTRRRQPRWKTWRQPRQTTQLCPRHAQGLALLARTYRRSRQGPSLPMPTAVSLLHQFVPPTFASRSAFPTKTRTRCHLLLLLPPLPQHRCRPLSQSLYRDRRTRPTTRRSEPWYAISSPIRRRSGEAHCGSDSTTFSGLCRYWEARHW